MTLIRKQQLIDENWDDIGIQNPLQVDGDSVHSTDIDYANSDFTGWTGDTTDPFQSPFSASITNSTASNPKQITLAFNRTIKAQQIGFGENNGGDFSNVKISLLWSGWVTRSIYDMSTDNTKQTSLNAEFEDEVFNSVLIEFYTADQVDISNITIQKARYNTTQIIAKTPQDTFTNVNANRFWNLLISLDEQKDAFGRLRVSEPYTIFDNSLTNPASDALFWSTLTNATGSWAYDRNTSSYTLSTATAWDYVVRQTKQRFKYQPGKSHMVLLTGLAEIETWQIKIAWLLDYDNVWLGTITNTPQNGVCMENNNGTISFCVYNNWVATETADQDDWNIDKLDWTGKSWFTLDVDSTNIIFFDLERLWVGAVRCGFVSPNGEIVVAHQFRHASNSFTNVYMRTANLPISYSITSTAWAWSLKQICSSVISEGWFNPKW